MSVNYRKVDVNGIDIFYRVAGRPSDPTVLLLHGFPSSSHMFRELIPILAEQFYVVAPDFPGFGQSSMPDREEYQYTFANISNTISKFTEVIGIKKFAIYIFDYGAPVGLRMATQFPNRISAIISQNGNAYEEGLSAGWDPVKAYWKEDSQANRDALRAFLQPETTIFQYTHGVQDSSLVSPDGRSLDDFYLARPGADEIQLDLLKNYVTNVELYPQFQEYFRKEHPPLLAVWGKNDPFFLPAGAEAFKRDIPKAEVHLFETGHFALETHGREIADVIIPFLVKSVGVI
jgi:pimeloyl-ACP methyl ester carboxylesterase